MGCIFVQARDVPGGLSHRKCPSDGLLYMMKAAERADYIIVYEIFTVC